MQQQPSLGGAIKMSEIAAEFNIPAQSRKMSRLYRGGQFVPHSSTNTNVPQSGPVRLSNLYGARKATPPPVIPTSGIQHRWPLAGSVSEVMANLPYTRATNLNTATTFAQGGIGGTSLSGAGFVTPLPSPIPSWSLSWWFSCTSDQLGTSQPAGLTAPVISPQFLSDTTIWSFVFAPTTPSPVTILGPDTQPVLANRWYHLVATSSAAGGVCAYVNGALLGTNATASAGPLSSFISIGGTGNLTTAPQNRFVSYNKVSDVILYNRVLTAEEVTSIYNFRPALINDDWYTKAVIASYGASPQPRTISAAQWFSGADAYPITSFTLTSNPMGNATLNSTTGVLQITPRASSSSTYTVNIHAANSVGASPLASVNVVESPVEALQSYQSALNAIPGLIHRYKFENSLSDSAGTAHGVPFRNGVEYTTLYNKCFTSAMRSRGGARVYPSLLDGGSVTNPNTDPTAAASATSNLPWTISFFYMLSRSLNNNSRQSGRLFAMTSAGVIKYFASQMATTFRMYGNGSVMVLDYSGAPKTTDTWYHVAITSDGTSQIVLYHDGIQRATSAGLYSNVTTAWDTLTIGASGDPDNSKLWFPGLIAEFCIFNRVLTAAEILSLATANAP